jgi:hypothetical protein
MLPNAIIPVALKALLKRAHARKLRELPSCVIKRTLTPP